MWTANSSDNRFGHFVPTIENQFAFVPNSLPPSLNWTSELVAALSDANLTIGRLHGIGLNQPNPNLLIAPFIRREAELSSRIEGTVATMQQLYLFEVESGVERIESEVPDVREVANYVRAFEHGLKRPNELPVCLRMVRELHEILLRDVRGEHRMPGQFRPSQNWLGPLGCPIQQASYIPPPPEQMMACLDAFERFLNEPLDNIPVLTWLAMVHYQFEAIHPFLDGNGRIGRLLIILLMRAKGVLDKPLLYLSAYFERNRLEYYEHLLRVSTHGEWEQCVLFFLRGIIEQSTDAFERSRELLQLQQKYRSMIKSKRPALQLKLVDLLVERPVLTIPYVGRQFGVTYLTARNNIFNLVKVGILKEVTGAKRNKIFVANEVLNVINKPLSTIQQPA